MPAVAISNFFHRTTRSLQGAARHHAGPIELLAIPAPLRPFDDAFLPEWADGRFALAGHSVPLQGNWPFDIRHAPAAWRQAFRGFGWLRHVPASVEPDGERRVQSLIAAWLRSGSSRSAEALADDVVARRIMSWLAHADLLLQTPDARFYDAVLQALSADVALLERRWRTIESGYVRLISLIALAQAGLCLSNGAAILQTAETALVKEVTAHAMAPSSALIRDPDAVAELLLDLEPLRLLYKTRQRPLPPLLAIAIVNIRRSLAGVLLGDGSPARLGNARRGPMARSAHAAVVRHVGLDPIGSIYAPAGGYARLVQGETCAVIDVGAPIDSAEALGFEMSSGTALMVVHDGRDRASLAGSRGTMFHQAPPRQPRAKLRPRGSLHVLEPAHTVAIELENAGAQHVDATHAGRAQSGFVHRRRLTLAQNGNCLSGIDEIRPLAGGQTLDDDAFAVRFVLHPAVSVAIGPTADEIVLTLPNGHCWRFTAPDGSISAEGAVFRDGTHTLPSMQILASTVSAGGRCMNWRFTRVEDATVTGLGADQQSRRRLADALATIDSGASQGATAQAG